MRTIDWIVVTVYMVGMLAVGEYYARKSKTEEDYLLGGRNMGALSVGLSMFASLLSTLTYLAVPGEIINHGPMVCSDVVTYPIVFLIIGYLLIPYIVRLNVTSAYEILEKRFGLGARLLGSVLFLLLRLFWMGMIVYVTTAQVLVPLMRLPTWATPYACVAMGLITVVYTSMGGLRAVVVTDAIQSLILLSGAILALVVVTMSLGGVEQWWPTHWSPHWDTFRIGVDSEARVTVLAAMIAGMSWWICTYGSDQIIIQRYLATRSASSARVALGVSLVTSTLSIVLLGLVGLALLAYFKTHPDLLPPEVTIEQHADQLFPHFIVIGFPPGVTGLVIAGLLAAAMSSLSSGVNSTSAVIAVDFIDRLGGTGQESAQVRRTKVISWTVGIATVAVSTLTGLIEGNLIEVTFKTNMLFVGPLFLLFFMAIFIPWATWLGALSAVIASGVMAVGVAYYHWFGLNFIWILPASLAAGMIVGPLVSLLPISFDDSTTKKSGRSQAQ